MIKGLVDIIIPVYNSEKYLKECLDSVFNQKYQNIHVNIVYTPSVDNTLKIIEKYIGRFEDKINLIITEKGANQAEARNKALKKVKGEYIAFLDSDDYWHPDKLYKQINIIKNSNAGGTYTDVIVIDEKGKEIQRLETPEWNRSSWLRKRYITFSSILLKTIYVKKQKIFFDKNLKIGEDFDFLINFSKYTNLKKTHGFYTFYRIHSQNVTRNIKSAIRYRMIVYRKHKMYLLYLYSYLAYLKYSIFKFFKQK